MPQYIMDMGPIGLLNTLILFIMTLFALKNAYLLFIRKPGDNLSGLGRSINTMLFWGVIVVILGFIGSAIGMQSAIDSLHDMYTPRGNIAARPDTIGAYIIQSQEELQELKEMDSPPKVVMLDPKSSQSGANIPNTERDNDSEILLLLLAAIYQLLKLPIFSLTGFLVISLVWYLFTAQHRRLLARSMKEEYAAE